MGPVSQRSTRDASAVRGSSWPNVQTLPGPERGWDENYHLVHYTFSFFRAVIMILDDIRLRS